MIIAKLIGGLGNQMFQYSLGRHLSQKNKTELKIDITGFESYKLHKYSLDAFNIKKIIASKNEVDKFKKYQARRGKKWFLYNKFIADDSKYFQEKSFSFDLMALELNSDTYIDGHWQSEKYFKEIEPIIRADFSFVLKQGEKDLIVSKLISECNAISVHIRRADYITNTATNKVHGSCSAEYYKKATETMAEKINNPVFFVFSDDHNWAKQNIKNKYPAVYVDHNDADSNYQDMRLMASCKHNIIANSTFSWWGAWLNGNKDKIVIAPKKWFADSDKNENDIIPPEWIKI